MTQLDREIEDANRSERLRYHLHMIQSERCVAGGFGVILIVAALLYLIVRAVAG